MKNSTCARSAGVTGAPPLIPSQTPVLRPGRVLVFSIAGARVVLTVSTQQHLQALACPSSYQFETGTIPAISQNLVSCSCSGFKVTTLAVHCPGMHICWFNNCFGFLDLYSLAFNFPFQLFPQ